MFAADPLAREVCEEGLEAGFDRNLAFDERVFFYLPLEHSESMEDQDRCRALFEHLLQGAPEALAGDAAYYLEFADRHRDIIKRFGRYPHRNGLLGRPSTPEELEFLRGPGSSF
jgi:uncharacterized protein (DUF924 family)